MRDLPVDGDVSGNAAGPRRRDGETLPVVLDQVGYAARDAALIGDLSLTLEGADVTVLMGPNGAGKSLTLRLIAGLLKPTSGTIRWAGRETPLRHSVGLVFQRPVMLRRTVRANLDHALAAYGVPRGARAERIAHLLSLAQLEDRGERPARVLSAGEQQRLSMVRALAADPDLLLLDEPTASLDPQSTAIIEGLVHRAADAGVKTVLVTHQRGQARRMAGEVAFIHRGRLTEVTPARRFFDRPQSDAARAYMAGELLV